MPPVASGRLAPRPEKLATLLRRWARNRPALGLQRRDQNDRSRAAALQAPGGLVGEQVGCQVGEGLGQQGVTRRQGRSAEMPSRVLRSAGPQGGGLRPRSPETRGHRNKWLRIRGPLWRLRQWPIKLAEGARQRTGFGAPPSRIVSGPPSAPVRRLPPQPRSQDGQLHQGH